MRPEQFQSLTASLRDCGPLMLWVCTPAGKIVLGRQKRGLAAAAATRRLAIQEALLWGEATFHLCAPRLLIWAVPLLHNAQLRGGVVAAVDETQAFAPTLDLRRAATTLREALEAMNLTNAGLLELRRLHSSSEQRKAMAIHEAKALQAIGPESPFHFQRMYLLEEPALLGAIRRGDRREARAVLNGLLVGILHAADGRLELTKSFFLELVVTMTRTAVEAGGEPQELLGARFASLTELAAIEDEQQLSAWLSALLERILAQLHVHRENTRQVLLGRALDYMQRHLAGQISRDDVAQAAGLSPSHFSRTFARHFGCSFTQALHRLRVDRAADLLLRTDRPLAVIALEAGFPDQSYFTRIFQRYRGQPPARFRREHAGSGQG